MGKTSPMRPALLWSIGLMVLIAHLSQGCILDERASKSSYQSVDGEFELQSWNFQTQGAISLDGYWALWNEEFIEPLPDSPLPSFSFSYIPYTRAAGKLSNSAVPSKFGTYRARIFLQPEQMKEPLALSLRGYHAAASIRWSSARRY